MKTGRIAVSDDSFYCGAENGAVCQLALKSDIPSVTPYVHPSTKQCNYAYTHPTTKQCNYSVDLTNYVTKEELEEAIGVQAQIVGSYAVNASGSTRTIAVSQCDYAELYGVTYDDGNYSAAASYKTIIYKGGTACLSGAGTFNLINVSLNANGTQISVPSTNSSPVAFTAVCYKYV